MTEANNNSCCGTNTVENILKMVNIKIFIDETKCTGCGLCGEVCPFGLPQPNNDSKFAINHPELCTECSACYRNCPVQAIVLQEQKGCGCLWNARQVFKSKGNDSQCCG